MATTQVGTEPLYWDPLNHALNERPYDIYRRLRDEAPVYYNDRYGFYVLSRFDDVFQARLNTKVFSSSHSVQFERLLDPSMPLNFMNDADPPEHTAVRRPVMREFTPGKIQLLEDSVRSTCRRLLDAKVGGGEFDYVRDFAEPFPFLTICEFLGIEEEHQSLVWSWWVEREAQLVKERDTPDLSASVAMENLIRDFLLELSLARREEPKDDMMSYLVTTQVDDGEGGTRGLTESEVAQYCNAFFVAGSATTTQLIGWAAVLLAENPEQRRRLVQDPSLIPNANEEILRLEPPAPSGGRWLFEPVTLHGTLMPKDSVVMLHTAAASRDDREYERPDEMDVTRKVRQLAFGYGVHLCIGAALARLEGKIALEETLSRFPEWSIDTSAAEMRISSGLRGWKSLPFTPK